MPSWRHDHRESMVKLSTYEFVTQRKLRELDPRPLLNQMYGWILKCIESGMYKFLNEVLFFLVQ